jgi:hypothetical protein
MNGERDWGAGRSRPFYKTGSYFLIIYHNFYSFRVSSLFGVVNVINIKKVQLTKLSPWSRVLLERISHSASQEIPSLYGTRGFIIVFTRADTGPYPDPHASSPHLPTQCPFRF